MSKWNKAQKWESGWWGNCINTYGEEEKQLLYADRMGLVKVHNHISPYNFDMRDRRILDIGGGPASLLLKCVNVKGFVVDPILQYVPNWVKLRYSEAGIGFVEGPGENGLEWETRFDEVWLYNVLQHTEDPEAIIVNARASGDVIRIFEWIDTPVNIGHIHTLTEEKLNEWLGGYGKVEQLDGYQGCYGKCFYGIFPA